MNSDPQDTADLSEYEKTSRELGEKRRNRAILKFAERLTVGDGVPKDLHRAEMWYEIAGRLYVTGAIEGLNKVRSLLKAEERNKGKQTTLD